MDIYMVVIAARVVDLPEPVGPVTSTSPRGLIENSARIGGRSRSVRVGISFLKMTEERWPCFLSDDTRLHGDGNLLEDTYVKSVSIGL